MAGTSRERNPKISQKERGFISTFDSSFPDNEFREIRRLIVDWDKLPEARIVTSYLNRPEVHKIEEWLLQKFVFYIKKFALNLLKTGDGLLSNYHRVSSPTPVELGSNWYIEGTRSVIQFHNQEKKANNLKDIYENALNNRYQTLLGGQLINTISEKEIQKLKTQYLNSLNVLKNLKSKASTYLYQAPVFEAIYHLISNDGTQYNEELGQKWKELEYQYLRDKNKLPEQEKDDFILSVLNESNRIFFTQTVRHIRVKLKECQQGKESWRIFEFQFILMIHELFPENSLHYKTNRKICYIAKEFAFGTDIMGAFRSFITAIGLGAMVVGFSFTGGIGLALSSELIAMLIIDGIILVADALLFIDLLNQQEIASKIDRAAVIDKAYKVSKIKALSSSELTIETTTFILSVVGVAAQSVVLATKSVKKAKEVLRNRRQFVQSLEEDLHKEIAQLEKLTEYKKAIKQRLSAVKKELEEASSFKKRNAKRKTQGLEPISMTEHLKLISQERGQKNKLISDVKKIDSKIGKLKRQRERGIAEKDFLDRGKQIRQSLPDSIPAKSIKYLKSIKRYNPRLEGTSQVYKMLMGMEKLERSNLPPHTKGEIFEYLCVQYDQPVSGLLDLNDIKPIFPVYDLYTLNSKGFIDKIYSNAIGLQSHIDKKLKYFKGPLSELNGETIKMAVFDLHKKKLLESLNKIPPPKNFRKYKRELLKAAYLELEQKGYLLLDSGQRNMIRPVHMEKVVFANFEHIPEGELIKTISEWTFTHFQGFVETTSLK